jgi:hypothetical protein
LKGDGCSIIAGVCRWHFQWLAEIAVGSSLVAASFWQQQIVDSEIGGCSIIARSCCWQFSKQADTALGFRLAAADYCSNILQFRNMPRRILACSCCRQLCEQRKVLLDPAGQRSMLAGFDVGCF